MEGYLMIRKLTAILMALMLTLGGILVQLLK